MVADKTKMPTNNNKGQTTVITVYRRRNRGLSLIFMLIFMAKG